jgi:hypothetical protein
MRDEEKWGTRPKYDYQDNVRVKVADEPVPWFQLASMAQTRAGSKALRNKEAWIAVLAGYKPTPAEEMTGNETSAQPPTTEHWCKEHNTAFFMRGKMKSYAHPIGDTGEWCHEHKEKAAPKSESKTAGSAVAQDSSEPAAPASDSSKTETVEPTELTNMEFKNPGEFFTACLKYFKLAKSQAEKDVPEYDLSNPGQRQRAWQTIVSIYGAKPGA